MEAKSQEISTGKAYLIYFGLLIGAMIIACPNPQMASVALMFPIGISALFLNPSSHPSSVPLVVGYLIHFTFFFLFGAIRQRPGFYALCFVFILFLLLNVSGCHKIFDGLSHIT